MEFIYIYIYTHTHTHTHTHHEYQSESAVSLRESVLLVKLHRRNQKQQYPKLMRYGRIEERNIKECESYTSTVYQILLKLRGTGSSSYVNTCT